MGKASRNKRLRQQGGEHAVSRDKVFARLDRSGWTKYQKGFQRVFQTAADSLLPDAWDLVTVVMSFDDGALSVMSGARRAPGVGHGYEFLSLTGEPLDELTSMTQTWFDELISAGLGPWDILCIDIRPGRLRHDDRPLVYLSPMWSDDPGYRRSGFDLDAWIQSLGSFPMALAKVHESFADVAGGAPGSQGSRSNSDFDGVLKRWNGRLLDELTPVLNATIPAWEWLTVQIRLSDLLSDPKVDVVVATGNALVFEPVGLSDLDQANLVRAATSMRAQLARDGHAIPLAVLVTTGRDAKYRQVLTLSPKPDSEESDDLFSIEALADGQTSSFARLINDGIDLRAAFGVEGTAHRG